MIFLRIKRDFFFSFACRIPLSSTISTAFLPSNLSSLYLSPRHSTRSIFHPHLRYSLHLISVLTRKLDSLEGNRLDFSTIFTSLNSIVKVHNSYFFFICRNNCLGLSKPEFSSENGNKICRNDGVANDASQLYDNSAELQENFDPRVSMEEVSVEASNDSKFAIELPQALKYDCGSPGCDSNPCNIESNCMTEMASTSVSVVQFVQEASENGASEADVRLQRTCQMEQKNEVTGCEWESLISDAADLLIFNLPNDSEDFKGLMQKSLDSGGRYASVTPRYINGQPIMEMIDPVGTDHQNGMEHQSTQPGETSILNDELDECFTGDPSENGVTAMGMSNPASCKVKVATCFCCQIVLHIKSHCIRKFVGSFFNHSLSICINV